MAIKNREAAARNPRGGARRGAGRPLGRTDTVPRKGTASEKDRFQALQYEYGKLLKENERLRNELQYGAKFNGTIEEMFLASARGEYVPTQMQAYTGKVILDRQPPSVIETPVTEKDKEENEKEWQKLFEYFAAMAIRETIFQTNGRPAGDAGVPHWVPTLVSRVVAETQALLNVPLTEVMPARQRVFRGGQGGQRPDTAPQHGCDTSEKIQQSEYVKPKRADLQSPSQPQPQRQQNGAAQPQDAPVSNGRDIKRYMFGLPHKAFWLGNKRYDSNEHGEIDVTDASPEDIEQLDRHGYRAKR